MNKSHERVAKALGEDISPRFLLSRSGHPLLALPADGASARRALGLYQPQRGISRKVALLLRIGSRAGLHRFLLTKTTPNNSPTGDRGLLPDGVDPESVGILFGSADHKIFRAVLSYRNGSTWEVGKLAIGDDGAAMLDREATAMREIRTLTPEVPKLLGLEKSGDARLLRMPYLIGKSLALGHTAPVRRLLESWLLDAESVALREYPEWIAITRGLSEFPDALKSLNHLGSVQLRPSILHGDLARWNLLETTEGKLTVLDWEWGATRGMPGLDLVHYLAQDFRLVDRLPPQQVIAETVSALRKAPWHRYLADCGWAGNEHALVLACLAYKQGAGHQDNREFLHIL